MNRTEFRLNRRALLGMTVLAAAGAMPVHAATISVTTFADEDGTEVTSSGCSLREAVLSVNGGKNVGDCAADVTEAYGTNDTINLLAGTYVLSIPGGQAEDWYAASGDPLVYVLDSKPNAEIGDLDLTASVKIVGDPAGGTIIDGSDLDRVFQIVDPTNTKTVDVSLSNLTVQNGTVGWVAIDDATPDPLDTPYWLFKKLGGGIATGVAAAVTQYVPTEHGPGVTDPGMNQQMGAPGGEEEVGATYSLTLNNVAVINNVSAADGGGIYNVAALTADGVVIDGNTAAANGGGLYNEAKTLIRGSRISNNTAEGGGAIFLTGSPQTPVYVIKSSLMDNTATGGGGISGRSQPPLYVANSTISGNTGNDVGGGIYTNGAASLVNTTVADNTAGLVEDNVTGGAGLNAFASGSFTLWNTLLANNTKTIGAVPANCGQTGGGAPNIISKGHNLESLASTCANLTGSSSGLTTTTNDLFGATADAKLAARGADGVYPLNTGSSAINTGDSAATFQDGSGAEVAVTDDQLGTLRPAGQFDIGAFELATAVPVPSGGGGGGGCTVGSNGRLDPTLPAMLAAALAFLGWRRRAAK
jgi:CSLREA domain-containing protein